MAGTQSRLSKGEPNVALRNLVAARIREARALTGLSQVALAKELGRGERTVQAWERAERTPRLTQLQPLAEKVDRPVAWFYGDGDEAINEEKEAA
jgi:transcriptional regulator with XRE-family HTH domain